jgi:hypothetical protein
LIHLRERPGADQNRKDHHSNKPKHSVILPLLQEPS